MGNDRGLAVPAPLWVGPAKSAGNGLGILALTTESMHQELFSVIFLAA